MRYTISGFWTAIIIAVIMTVLLYIITKSPKIYRTVNPNIIIVFAFLVIIRMLFPLEIDNAKGIFILKVVPQIDTAIRYPVFDIFGNTIRIWMLLIVIWGIGAAVQIYIMIQQYTSMKKLLYFCKPLSKEKMSVVRLAEKEMGVKGKIQYMVSENYASPFIFGTFMSIIVLPSGIENLSDEQVHMILCHELSHYNRRDGITKMSFKVLGCIFWWMPCMKPLMKKLDEAIEVRADYDTIKRMTEEKKTDYLMLLYSIARMEREKKTSIEYANMFTCGQVDTIERRFRFISEYKKWRLTIFFMVLGLTLCFSSYLMVIEPEYQPNDSAVSCENTCYIYKQENSTYKIYMDDVELGVMNDISFLNDSYFDKIEIKIIEGEKR